MTEKSSLQAAIEKATQLQSWPLFDGDPNLVDVYNHVGKVIDLLGLQLPMEFPIKDTGVKLVECVEEYFIKHSLIRDSPQSLVERGIRLVEEIQVQGLLSFEAQESYAVALYTWHGCINMAKLLRKTYVTKYGEESYTNEIRLAGYDLLKSCWRNENARDSQWIRYGASLASFLERKRGNPIEDNWVPKDSPYWDLIVFS